MGEVKHRALGWNAFVRGTEVSCLTCWFLLLQTLQFPRIFKKIKVSLLQKYFLGLKSGISFQALCCTLAAGPETTILHSTTGCTQCLKLTQNQNFISIQRASVAWEKIIGRCSTEAKYSKPEKPQGITGASKQGCTFNWPGNDLNKNPLLSVGCQKATRILLLYSYSLNYFTCW